MYERVTKSEHRPARSLAHETITKLHEAFRDEYTFYSQYVGSCKWGTVIRDDNREFDIDYQIILTHNLKVFKENGKFDPTETKKKFMSKIQEILTSSRLEDSTTAITLNDSDKDFSIDFVIIDGTNDENWKIIRRNNKDSKNEYTWNEMSDVRGYSKYYRSLEEHERYKLAKEIMDLKAEDKKSPEHRKKGSYVLTIQAIKEYRDKHENKR